MSEVKKLTFPLSPWMSRQEVADYLRVHPNSVDKLARNGVLTRYRVEGMNQLLYKRDEVAGIVFEDEHPDSNASRRSKTTAMRETTA